VTNSLDARVVRLAAEAGVEVGGTLAGQLAAYLGLLAKWNVTLNLTGFELDRPSDEAIRRLLVEPLAAAALVPVTVKVAVDVGSGGGSPALPLKLLRPSIQFVLVESKARKGAFLREAIRHLGIERAEIATERFEDFSARADRQASADLITVRAVRVDENRWLQMASVLGPGGCVLLFGTRASSPPVHLPFVAASTLEVPGSDVLITSAARL